MFSNLQKRQSGSNIVLSAKKPRLDGLMKSNNDILSDNSFYPFNKKEKTNIQHSDVSEEVNVQQETKNTLENTHNNQDEKSEVVGSILIEMLNSLSI